MQDGAEFGSGRGPDSVSTTMLNRLTMLDPESWAAWCEWMGKVAFGWCRQAGVQPADARNIVQEMFVSVALNLVTFSRSGAGQTFGGWVHTIVQNKIRDYWRKRSREPRVIGGTDALSRFAQVADRHGGSHDDPIRSDHPSWIQPDTAGSDCFIIHCAMKRAKERHSESHWKAFWRTAVDGQKSADVAAELGMTAHAVRKVKSRVLHDIRQDVSGLLSFPTDSC